MKVGMHWKESKSDNSISSGATWANVWFSSLLDVVRTNQSL